MDTTAPEAIEEEKTTPVPAQSLAQLAADYERAMRRRLAWVPASDIDALNGVDDRGKW